MAPGPTVSTHWPPLLAHIYTMPPPSHALKCHELMAKKPELKNPSRRTLCPALYSAKTEIRPIIIAQNGNNGKLSSVSIKTVAEELRDMDEQIALPNIRV